MKPQVVFLLGAPGAGKSTQCKNLEREFDFVHVPVGDLFRSECNNPDSKLKGLIEGTMQQGKLVSGEITCMVINTAMGNSEGEQFLIDGFPRSQNNHDAWIDTMAQKIEVIFVIFFECTKDVSYERCQKRAETTEGRNDDTAEVFEKRWNVYITETVPCIESLKEKYIVKSIDATSTPDQVYRHLTKAFNDEGIHPINPTE